MKIALFAFLAGCITLCACSKTETTELIIPATGPYLQATVDGTAISFSNFIYSGCEEPDRFGYRVITPEGASVPATDHLFFRSTTPDGSAQIAISLKQIFLWRGDFPVTMESKKIGGDLIRMEYSQRDETGNRLRWDLDNRLGQLVIESWDEDGWLTGSFTAELRSSDGLQVKRLEGGRFRIPVTTVTGEPQ